MGTEHPLTEEEQAAFILGHWYVVGVTRKGVTYLGTMVKGAIMPQAVVVVRELGIPPLPTPVVNGQSLSIVRLYSYREFEPGKRTEDFGPYTPTASEISYTG